MIGGVDGYKWNITDSYDNNINQRNNVNNKDELGQKGVLDADVNNKDELGKKGAVDKSKTTECQTCKNRKYVDGSNEANVPLKMLRIFHRKRHLLLSGHMRGSMFPMRITKLPRKTAKWYLHPSESRHRSARNVARSYISGGVTDTQIRYYNESNPYQQDLKQTDGIKLRGANVDEIG